MFSTHTQELRNARNANAHRCTCVKRFRKRTSLPFFLQLYSRIVCRFLGLRGRIGRRFRNRRHFQSKQWSAHALGSVARVHARQRTVDAERGNTNIPPRLSLRPGVSYVLLAHLTFIIAHTPWTLMSYWHRKCIYERSYPIFIRNQDVMQRILEVMLEFIDGTLWRCCFHGCVQDI